MTTGWVRRDVPGNALVETALAFPILLMVALGLIQFAIFVHAQLVVTGAAQDGARIAAAEDRGLAEGLTHTQSLLQAGLGEHAKGVTAWGSADDDMVAIEAEGRLPTIIPWVVKTSLPLHARSVVSKERFRVGSGP
ncbi:TadE family protein [Nitrolancea hollandica]|uniref:TadE-like domain-containing protein n=1 Tax=Nitrolancea hollandica Lb TaxID=1129897 RepID=I4EL58_9BACT|nr:TadE/TadG family type IV pilus assembly protein [Nitrolancea hollandica]CCF85420.1 hypothetical protein NITHO_4950003 [Nitrolancea hollandica Lb]